MKRKQLLFMCALLSTAVLSACGIKSVWADDPKTLETESKTEENRNVSEHETSEDEMNETEETNKKAFAPGTSRENAAWIPLGERINETLYDEEEDWYGFTTGDAPAEVYNVTCVNASPNGDEVYFTVYDENGESVNGGITFGDGRANTLYLKNCEANTAYYIETTLHGGGSTDYFISVENPQEANADFKTSGDIIEAKGASSDSEIYAGTNQYNAVMIPFDMEISGSLAENEVAWFAFKTGKVSGEPYKITAENKTQKELGRLNLKCAVYDKYGDEQGANIMARNGDGPKNKIWDDLKADTVYYMALSSYTHVPLDYTLILKTPESRTPLKIEEKVFEVPFELNETQVQFVANQAVFIDEVKAKEKLKPVAEAILEHPNRSILIAGTTATDGPQDGAVTLSNRRAQAVKNLLVNTYNVPESQLQIIGLGYERDPFERGKDRDSNGNFVESEGRKNRRVIILDIDDPVAQEILKKNM